jgi:hypothetical protein
MGAGATQSSAAGNVPRDTGVKPQPANDDRKPEIVRTKPPKPAPSPAAAARPFAIVTARRPSKRYVEVPEVSASEHRRVAISPIR